MRRGQVPEFSEYARWRAYGEISTRPDVDSWEVWWFGHPMVHPSENACREVWNALKDEVLTYWSRERPGHRPEFWWIFEAPRASDESLIQMGESDKSFV